MGRRGYAIVKQAEYGNCISDWAQSSAYAFLKRNHIDVESPGEMCNTEDADHWEITLPGKLSPDGFKPDVSKMRRIINKLRKRPDFVMADDCPVGDQFADVLKDGVDAAVEHRYAVISIDWF